MAALVMIAGLVATACGARLPEAVHQQAQAAVLNANTGGGADLGTGSGPTDATVPGTTDHNAGGGNLGTGTTAVGPGGGGPASTTGGKTKTGNTKTGTNGKTESSGGGTTCGTGTDVGLTSSNITLGTISDVTGPVSGLFQGAQQGAVTFANFLNATNGGLCGHHVSVAFRDGGTNCTQTQNAAQDLVSKVFAFVGTFALYDNCAATVLKAHPTVSDVHVSLDPAAGALKNHFDLEPGGLGYANGMFAYYAKKYGDKVKHVGTIAEALPSALAKQSAIVHAAESAGWKFVYQQNEQPTNANFQGDFVKMCQQEHIQIFFTVTEDAANAATMIRNENQAGCPKNLINVIPIAYDQAFLDSFKGNTSLIEGLQGYNEYALFFNRDEAAQIPELKLFQEWFQRSYPGQPANLYAMYAWASGRLFQQAFEHAGKVTNRRSVLAALDKVRNFSANGMVAPVDPSSKTVGAHCYILWQFSGGEFRRVADPPVSGKTQGYRCDGRFVRK